MRLSREERLWLEGECPRPYSLTDTEFQYGKLNRKQIRDGLELVRQGRTMEEAADYMRERGLNTSVVRIVRALKQFEGKL